MIGEADNRFKLRDRAYGLILFRLIDVVFPFVLFCFIELMSFDKEEVGMTEWECSIGSCVSACWVIDYMV